MAEFLGGRRYVVGTFRVPETRFPLTQCADYITKKSCRTRRRLAFDGNTGTKALLGEKSFIAAEIAGENLAHPLDAPDR